MPVTVPPSGIPEKIITGIFWIFLALAVCLVPALLILNQDVFLAASNYLQLAAAAIGAVAFCVAYFRSGRKKHFAWAAGAFGIWAAANAAWYVNVFLGLRAIVFPSLIDMGFLAFMFLLASAFQVALPRTRVNPKISLGILVLLLITPIAIFLAMGITASTLMTFLYFFFAAALIIIGLSHSLREHPFLFSGTLLYCIAFMVYPLREVLFPGIAWLNIIGPVVIASFSLTVIGFFREPAEKASG